MENDLIPKAGYPLVNIKMTGLERGMSPKQIAHNISAVTQLAAADIKAAQLLKKRKPDAVIGTGGYICYPVLAQAAKLKIPTFLHDSNAVPGLTTKLLSDRVTRMLTAFPNLEQRYKRPDRVTFVGTPVRSGFGAYTRQSARRELGIPDGEKLVVSFFGSLGAARMNELARAMIERNERCHDFRHIHAFGGNDAAANTESQSSDWTDARAYINDMPRVMAAADLIICRAGGSTLAELSAIGRAAVLIPSPNVTNDHQTPNALAVSEAGGAVMLRESECTEDTLYDTVLSLLQSPSRIAEMERKQRELGAADAANTIAELIISAL
jgi:UDP-N-acetylglucosamine--N-acetylmuramyl-(pentapeptide) pyrophosphoryl-undecaprenol N-acetylglucosamine transferase